MNDRNLSMRPLNGKIRLIHGLLFMEEVDADVEEEEEEEEEETTSGLDGEEGVDEEGVLTS